MNTHKHGRSRRTRTPRNLVASTQATRGATGRGAHSGYEALAKGLGVFSIGLGLAELLAPRSFCRAFGMEGQENLFRAYGVRELATGVAIMMSHDPAPWMWGRVGGDAIDLATMAVGADPKGAEEGEQRRNIGIAVAAVAGVTVMDAICAVGLGMDQRISSVGDYDYGDRTGFPRPADAMRGAASDFEVPADFRVPEPLRPWGADRPATATA